ncbi:hypothetical protein AM493_04965 [Flavobacterium akiainvivens]|uniref:CinA C-terminal domain-containing protein n=1 Tax=Flavobacterium akiainvivens TaxID=1202724 RepID=A0A0M9VHE2_9FLAO|nr:CinA family protein [Flavobacterium akiainvivens]KOS05450.1 hypothetical protein AM493_04965 [Flavobacterium akiainvivens]SFQ32284.1 nicotinamide-nucleotide amidase [Flavobacterium akiainvivens]
MAIKIVLECAQQIAAHGYKIAFVESATAGRMCAEFSLSPLSGKFLHGGISCYEVFIKENILKVPHELIEKHTPESAEVTAALAKHSMQLFKCDIVVAVTGLVSFGGSETEEKPVGTIFIHMLFPCGCISDRKVFSGNPEDIVLQTVQHAAELIIRKLESMGSIPQHT